MKPQFVTAIYTGLEGTRFNGNAQGGIYDRYKQSLRSLAAGGYRIACFTAAAHMEELTEYYKDYPNLTLIPFELENYVLHNAIESIKDKNSKYITDDSWRSRCVEIMWGKVSWLSSFYSEMDEDDSIFWIDAGIFHGGLISNTMRSANSKDFYDFDTITQQRNLFDDLVKYADGKFLNIRSQQVNHGSDDYHEIFKKRPEYGICAGIFGGKKKQILEYISAFGIVAVTVLGHDILLKEEELMYFIHQDPEFQHFFKTFEFNNWYHEDWGAPLYDPNKHVSFSDFFKVIRE